MLDHHIPTLDRNGAIFILWCQSSIDDSCHFCHAVHAVFLNMEGAEISADETHNERRHCFKQVRSQYKLKTGSFLCCSMFLCVTHLPVCSLMMKFSTVMVLFASSCSVTFNPKWITVVHFFLFKFKKLSRTVMWMSYPRLDDILWVWRAASHTQGHIHSEECITNVCRNKKQEVHNHWSVICHFPDHSKRNSDWNYTTFCRRPSSMCPPQTPYMSCPSHPLLQH